MIPSLDRIAGAILGGALGDGWGAPYEGILPPIRANVPEALVVTDDTQLTLATCEAVVEAGRVDPATIAARLLVWFREGRLRGLGASATKALRDLDAGAHWALAGAKGERAAGNGAAMRAAPLAFLLDPADPADRTTLRDVCRITHHHDEAYVGALAVVAALRLLVTGQSGAAGLLPEVAALLPDSQVRDRLLRYATFGDDVRPVDVADSWGSSGFVAESVPLALFAAAAIARRPFAEVIGPIIEAGGDTDTIASIAGQLAGAVVGAAALPEDLLARLRDRRAIAGAAEAFARAAMSPRGARSPA